MAQSSVSRFLMKFEAFPDLDGYDFVERIGGGSFSNVFKALQAPENSPVAIKCINRQIHAAAEESALQEIRIMKELQHENIVRLKDYHVKFRYVFIIMDFYPDGDLSKLLAASLYLTEEFVRKLMGQLASAMQCLRAKNICHMDLKPSNLFITKYPNIVLRLGDFGLSRVITLDNMERYRFNGTYYYMAPEKLLKVPYDASVDLWSIGIILFECLFGKHPYIPLSKESLVRHFNRKTPVTFPKSVGVSNCAENLITNLLKHDRMERITFEEFFNHEFFLPFNG